MGNNMKMHPAQIRPVRLAVSAALVAAATSAAGPAGAFDFRLGEWEGSWDTTLSYGQLYRVESPDLRLIGTADGGTGRSPNIDDGNLNYDTGLVSNAAKFVTELSLSRDSYGIFARAQGLYDFEVEDQPTERTELSDAAKDYVGSYVRMLDYFAYGRFDLSGHELDLRAGSMVVNWGESTFIQGGINSAINHFDVSALRVPGSELREAYLPQEMVKASFAITPNLTAEALYMFSWDETRPEPVGSYFAANDFAVRAGEKVILGFGAFSDMGVDYRPLGGPYIENFQAVPRGPTREADDQGQFGVALKLFLPDFSDGTEIGLYYLNYHSKVPLISGRTGTQAGIGNAVGTLASVAGAAQLLAAGLPPALAIQAAAANGVAAAAARGGNLSLATAQGYATVGVNTALGGGSVTAQASNLGAHEYAITAQYFTEYPEDIQLIGLSFNTQVGTTGIALQGEVSYKMDVPLQFDDVEVLFAALAPFEAAAAAFQGVTLPQVCTPLAPTLGACNQIGRFGVDEEIQGWDLYDVMQVQFTGTKVFGPMLGASQLVAVFEAAHTHVFDLPDKLTGGPNGVGLRFNGPGTSVSGNDLLRGRHFNEVEPQSRFADANSWGYRVALRMDYLSLIGPWNVSPRLVWADDVSGTTPGPGGNFVEDRHAITFGVNANLRSTWELDVSYTEFGGASRWNDLNDRDFVAATVKYSF
jgi:hypothetical protein